MVGRSDAVETRDGVDLSHLDSPLFDGANVSKRELVDYLDAVSACLLPELADRPLSVIRVRPGQPPFMQKNLPAYAPDWIPRVTIWSAASRRDVSYPLCHDRRTLLWLANQRAVEFHPALLRGRDATVTHLVLDLDPPEGAAFGAVVRAAAAVRVALADAGLGGAVKTSGAKGLHVVVPVVESTTVDAAAAATRALAARTGRIDPGAVTTAYVKEDREGKVFADSTRSGGATVVAAYSPRARPNVPVSFPVRWEDLDAVSPADFTVTTAAALIGDTDPWRTALPPPQPLPDALVAEGRAIPIARVVAMHEGKRRKQANRATTSDE